MYLTVFYIPNLYRPQIDIGAYALIFLRKSDIHNLLRSRTVGRNHRDFHFMRPIVIVIAYGSESYQMAMCDGLSS